MNQPTRIRATIKSHSSLLSSGFCCRPSPAGTAWELRAAIRVSRLFPRHGKRTEASDLLTPIDGWCPEGFDTADFQEAKRL
jgi:hypothetical protein